MDTNMYTHPSLASQLPTQAPAADKIRQAILATAMVDALGGPTEFQERFTFPKVTDMIPNDNFSLPPGYWTDDTSMTLCLARSLATFRSTTSSSSSSDRTERGGFDEGDQLRWYNQWYKHGTLSPNGRCFDIGSSVREALSIYARHRDVENALQQIQVRLDREECSGNGSLMRVLPIGLTYWRDEKAAREYARRSSRTTHPNLMCQEACEVWTKAIVEIMKASTAETPTMEPAYTKLDLVQTFAEFPFTNAQLREALQFPAGTPVPPTHNESRERHFFKYHPVLRLLARTQNQTIPSEEDLPSSGYVLHTLVAALYCFLATNSFEAGAIMAVNLGDDADTVGAIYAGLAGCWYAGTGASENGLWTERVLTWKSTLVRLKTVETVADDLAEFSAKLAGTS